MYTEAVFSWEKNVNSWQLKDRGFCEQTYAKPDCYCKSGPLWDVSLALKESGLAGGRRAGRLYRARPERSTFLFLWDGWNTFMSPTQHWNNTTPCLFFWTTILTHFYYWLCAKRGKMISMIKTTAVSWGTPAAAECYCTWHSNNSIGMSTTDIFQSCSYLTIQLHPKGYNMNVETSSVQDIINIYG